MADAVTAQWHGHNYQSRVFWLNAFNLLLPETCVSEVTFEADGPKAFDDVVVKYDPSVTRSGPDRVQAEYHQIKWHVQSGGRFGFQDFVDPAFVGATRFSLLERLKDARRTAPAMARFAFLTTHRISDDDPLAILVSGHDRSLLVERLFDNTTDRSRMGKVRKLWREHLGLNDDAELKVVVEPLRVIEGYHSLDELRSAVNHKARAVGLRTFSDTESDFRYDELARQLKVRKLNAMTRDSLIAMCQEENLLTEPTSCPDRCLPVAVRSFLGLAADVVGATPENTLLLTDEFRGRYLHDDRDWQRDILPKLKVFLENAVAKLPALRLILDAHASIAFIAGALLDLKSGVRVELAQKGQVGPRTWSADDGSTGAKFAAGTEELGPGREIGVAIGISRSVEIQTRDYVRERLPEVGQIASFVLPDGPGQRNVTGGEHAAALAEQVANGLRDIKAADPGATVHIFAASPNSFLFYLGQHHQGIGPSIVYEFDFDRRGNKSYQPSFKVD